MTARGSREAHNRVAVDRLMMGCEVAVAGSTLMKLVMNICQMYCAIMPYSRC